MGFSDNAYSNSSLITGVKLNMTNKLKWRLGKLPTSDEVRELVKASLITKEEAREILFNQETEETIEADNLKAEIKFLREIISKLSSHSQIVETIRYVGKPYYQYGWYAPYQTWCNYASGTINAYANTINGATIGSSQAAMNYALSTTDTTTSATAIGNSIGEDFTQIKTF